MEVNKRSFGEVIRNIGGHIRRRTFNWSLEYSKNCKDGGKVVLIGNSMNEQFCAIGRQREAHCNIVWRKPI